MSWSFVIAIAINKLVSKFIYKLEILNALNDLHPASTFPRILRCDNRASSRIMKSRSSLCRDYLLSY